MTGFEPQISGVGNDHSTNLATITAPSFIAFYLWNKTQTIAKERIDVIIVTIIVIFF